MWEPRYISEPRWGLFMQTEDGEVHLMTTFPARRHNTNGVFCGGGVGVQKPGFPTIGLSYKIRELGYYPKELVDLYDFLTVQPHPFVRRPKGFRRYLIGKDDKYRMEVNE